MATYLSSKRAINIYFKSKSRMYMGMGPVGCIPTRIQFKRVINTKSKFKLLLIIDKCRKIK